MAEIHHPGFPENHFVTDMDAHRLPFFHDLGRQVDPEWLDKLQDGFEQIAPSRAELILDEVPGAVYVPGKELKALRQGEEQKLRQVQTTEGVVHLLSLRGVLREADLTPVAVKVAQLAAVEPQRRHRRPNTKLLIARFEDVQNGSVNVVGHGKSAIKEALGVEQYGVDESVEGAPQHYITIGRIVAKHWTIKPGHLRAWREGLGKGVTLGPLGSVDVRVTK